MDALAALVDDALRAVPVDQVMTLLEGVARHDRYQASHGIHAAALLVAAAARSAGLAQVRVDTFAADGRAASWWTFAAPHSWTPRTARMTVTADDGAVLHIDHASQPFSIATGSAPTPPGGLRAPLARLTGPAGRLAGAMVLLDGAAAPLTSRCLQLQEAGAAGLIGAGAAGVARIELPPGSTLCGFSVTPARFARLCTWSDGGAHVHAEIDIDRSAPMPAVSAILPGAGPGEIWLTAHLCHPRPGANDNASGVAALVGAAATLQALDARHTSAPPRTVRFCWCPEFCGTAALLHQRMTAAGPDAHPDAVINLDMVGADQALGGAPFVLEQPPAAHGAACGALAARVVNVVFARTAHAGGRWRAAPFHGYSDHALFAGPLLGCPAVQLTHWPDPYNHTADDTVDKISTIEMVRSIAAAAVLAQLLRRARRNQSVARVFHAPAARPGQPCACWPGPLNLRAMTAALPPDRRATLAALVDTDKSALAVLANLAVRADGTQDRAAIIDATSEALQRPLDRSRSDWLFDTLLLSGWVASA